MCKINCSGGCKDCAPDEHFKVGDKVKITYKRISPVVNCMKDLDGEIGVITAAGSGIFDVKTNEKSPQFTWPIECLSLVEETIKPHKHAELIKAWADGAEVEVHCESDNEWRIAPRPHWYEETNYRIKPTPKPDVWKQVNVGIRTGYVCILNPEPNISLCFDGETGELKAAQVLKP